MRLRGESVVLLRARRRTIDASGHDERVGSSGRTRHDGYYEPRESFAGHDIVIRQ